MENCRRCGIKVENKSDLWCKKCKKRVDEELDGDISRPFEYYMRWWIRKKKSLADLYSNNKNKGQHTGTVQIVEKE